MAGACNGRPVANEFEGDIYVSVNLSKGQRVSLTKAGGGTLTRVRMGLGWDAMKKKGLFGGSKTQSIDLDASVLVNQDDDEELLDRSITLIRVA